MSPPEASCHPALLVDLIVENILIRLPPDEPECLARANFVCMGWHGVLHDPGFRRRYAKFHRRAPVLGLLYNYSGSFLSNLSFGSTTTFCPPTPLYYLQVLDSRHGLVVFVRQCNVLLDPEGASPFLLVWDPLTDTQWRIPFPDSPFADNTDFCYYNVAVLCAADGCDHADCHGHPFLLAYIGTHGDGLTSASCFYASKTGVWSYFTFIEHPYLAQVSPNCPSVLLGNIIYFSSESSGILEYNVSEQKLSWIDSPFTALGKRMNDCFLVTTEDDSLGLVHAEDSCMVMWTRVFDKNGAVEWAQCRIIDLNKLLPARALLEARLIGFMEGTGAILLQTYSEVLMFDINSCCVKNRFSAESSIDVAIPYRSFYTPRNSLERAKELFRKGCRAISKGNFDDAIRRLGHAHEIRAAFYGELSPECAMTCFKYGIALLFKADEESDLSILNSDQNEESVRSASEQDDAGNLKASVSNIKDAPSFEKGQNSNGKYQDNGNHDRDNCDVMAGDEDYSALDLARKMLDNARAIEKSPDHTMEKLQIFCTLAALSMDREDIDNSLDDCFKALAILDHFVEPKHHQIVTLNSRICSISELAFKIGDMIPYCAKVISLCSSHILNMEKAKGDKCNIAFSAEEGSEEPALENLMEFLTDTLIKFEEKLVGLKQGMSAPSPTISEVVIASKASGEQNAANSVSRAASLTCSQISGSSNTFDSPTISAAAPTGRTGCLKDVTVVSHPFRILEFSECMSGTKVNKLVKVLWSNQTESEATWEHEDMMLQKYPELFQAENGPREAQESKLRLPLA